MQSNRQKQIINLLMERGTLTARQLAGVLGVSTRTIYRDIVNLTAAGVPLSMTQGRDGGISLDAAYNPVLSNRSDEPDSDTDQTTTEWLEVDGVPLFPELRRAILERRPVQFHYMVGNSEKPCAVEPLKLLCRNRCWYLFGYSRIDETMAYYYLSRMRELQVNSTHYSRSCPEPLPPMDDGTPVLNVKMLVNQDVSWRIGEDFPSALVRSGSRLLVEGSFADTHALLSAILSYGDTLEVLEPESLRQKTRKALARAQQQYFE